MGVVERAVWSCSIEAYSASCQTLHRYVFRTSAGQLDQAREFSQIIITWLPVHATTGGKHTNPECR
jgi:hypothetical protein